MVSLEPDAAVAAGARWRIDDGEWRTDAAALPDVSVGTHSVSYADVEGWTKPADESVVIENQQQASLVRTYRQHTGSLTITLEPANARTAGAQWRVDDGVWKNSGELVTDLVIGAHAVSFKETTGWVVPENLAAQIAYSATTSLSATYTVDLTSLMVTIEPVAAVSDGAKWSVDGLNWKSSGESLTLSVGTYSLMFNDLAGWVEPPAESITLPHGEATSLTRTFTRQTGAVKVVMEPEGARTAGARWRLDGGEWRSSGETLQDASQGAHTISFASVTGWTTPADVSSIVKAGETTTVTRTYARQTGVLKVTLEPVAIRLLGAKWRVDGGVWHDSLAAEDGLVVGTHIVECLAVTGWPKPDAQNATISYNTTTNLTITYPVPTGSVTVAIEPEDAVAAGAKWRVDSGAWNASGATVSNLSIGQHVVSYNEISGWTRPADASVTAAYGSPISITGAYSPVTATLRVNIEPSDVRSVGARWRVDNGEWLEHGELVTGLEFGSHEVSFNAVNGWNAPEPQTVSLETAVTQTITGTYVSQTGSLQVVLAPEGARTAGAKWRVDLGEWQTSGKVVSGLAVGAHSVDFLEVSGWKTPTAIAPSVISGKTQTVTASYSESSGGLGCYGADQSTETFNANLRLGDVLILAFVTAFLNRIRPKIKIDSKHIRPE
jgi:hypothetical protein